MLRKMYLVSEKYYAKHCTPPVTNAYSERVVMRQKTDPLLHKKRVGLEQPSNVVAPAAATPTPHKPGSPRKRLVFDTPPPPPPLEDVYEHIPVATAKAEEEEDEEEDDEYELPGTELAEIAEYGKQHFGKLASPYIAPYFHNRRFLDQTYGIYRDENDGSFMIGNSPVEVDGQSNVIIQGNVYRGTQGLWELLTRKKVDFTHITHKDLETYKEILQLTNGHLKDNQPSNTVKTTRGEKYKYVISRLFPPKPKGMQRWTPYNA